MGPGLVVPAVPQASSVLCFAPATATWWAAVKNDVLLVLPLPEHSAVQAGNMLVLPAGPLPLTQRPWRR